LGPLVRLAKRVEIRRAWTMSFVVRSKACVSVRRSRTSPGERNRSKAMKTLIKKLKAAERLARLDHLEAKPHPSHGDLHKRDQCIAELVALGEPAVPLLVRRLASVDTTDRTSAIAMILQQIGDPAVPFLSRAIHSSDGHLRHNAISLLGRMGTPAAVCALDDDSVDLLDMEVLQEARLEARHRGDPPEAAVPDFPEAPGGARSSPGARRSPSVA